jgi:hypothetical protein
MGVSLMTRIFFWTIFFTAALLLLAGISNATSLEKHTINAAGNSYTSSSQFCVNLVLGESLTGQLNGSSTGSSLLLGYIIPASASTSVATPSSTPTESPVFTPTPLPPTNYFKILHSQINPNHGEQAAIKWTQAVSGPVGVTIYNMLGDRIITLAASQDFPSGQYNQVKWNGCNQKGEVVGSGIYLVVLQAPGRKEVGKAAVIK